MRFKIRISSRVVVLLLVMMTSLICLPSLASGSRDLIDDHAPNKFARSGRYYPVRNRNIVEELRPYVLEQVRNRIFPPFSYQHNANHRLRGRGSSERYYPVRNRNFEKEFQSNDLEQVRNRIFPRPPQVEPSGARPPQAGPSGARPPQAGPSGARPPQAGTTQPVYRGDLPQPSEDFPLEDPPPHYSEHEKAAPPPPYASLGQPAQPLSAADIHQPPPAYDQIYPKVPRPAAAGLAQGILYLGQRVLDQIAEGNPRPNIDPFDPQSQDAQRIFGLITPKIQRERQTLQDMQMKVATKIEGTPSFEFEATDITRPGRRREIVQCRVRANPTPMIQDFTISGLTCGRKELNQFLSFISIQYYPAARGKRASPNKIHNRVSPSIQRSRSGSLQSVSSNDDHSPPSYESVVGVNPPSYQSLFPGSAQPENPSRSSSLSTGSRPEESNPMGQTYIHKNSPEAKRVFAAIKPQLLQQHSEFRKIRLAPRVLKQELASSFSPFSVNYKFTLTATVLVKKRPFYRQDKVHRIPCLVQVYKTGASLNVYEMLCTCSSY